MQNETEAEIFRLKVRLSILEGLLIRLLLTALVSSDAPRAEAAAASLRRNLRRNADAALDEIGQLGDPALTAIYDEEVQQVHRSVIATVDATLAQILKGS